VERPRSAKSLCAGSIPAVASGAVENLIFIFIQIFPGIETALTSKKRIISKRKVSYEKRIYKAPKATFFILFMDLYVAGACTASA
jgi:hypothetical protein